MATPEQQAQTMIDNLPEKTGKSLQEWKTVLAGTALQKHGEIVKWLKAEHGMTHGFANLVSAKYREPDAPQGDDLVAQQYAGAKAALRPIYDALIERIAAFGEDVELAPKKAYVSLRRSKQFGLIQPSTKTRVDVGLNLRSAPDGAASERLEVSGSFNSMVSHRVRVSSAAEVDEELIGWLRAAYEEA